LDWGAIGRTLAAFRALFKRSQRGNLWTVFKGVTLTVFARDGDDADGFGWCTAGAGGAKVWSPGTYETEQDALRALARRFKME
jgi:hypothetical protein